ncbi:ATP-binding protein [Pseudomonas sp. SDO55104_S430]
MRLSDFITANIEPILQEWENFARTVNTPYPTMDNKGLRNHALQILSTIALDLDTPQTDQQQLAKSQGNAPVNPHETAAQTHAILRLIDGYSLDQVVSEYRALRSSVLRLWLAKAFVGEPHQLQDMMRFNEAIDQALGESITAYGNAVETTRKRVLAVLGHDLRSPLGAIMMSADLLQRPKKPDPERQANLTTQIGVSVRRANQIVDDLIDLARFNLGSELPLTRQNTDLTPVCQIAIDEVRAGYPQRQIHFNAQAAVKGEFDPLRMGQVFTNLISNAVQHGDRQQPVEASLEVDGGNVCFTVKSYGEPIGDREMPFLFDPQARYSTYSQDDQKKSSGLGLGLFITAEIVNGHGGSIEVQSTLEEGTIFRVTLPVK